MKIQVPVLVFSTFLLYSLLSGPADSQSADWRSLAPGDDEGYVPATLSEAEKSLDLSQAVELTLRNDPNYFLSVEDRRAQEGVKQEALGQFDWTLTGEVTWEHREQELREGVKRAEEEKRRQAADTEVLTCSLQDELTQKVDQLEAAQGGRSGVRITSDPGFDAQIRLLEAAILVADSNVEQRALEQTRDNLIATELAETVDALTVTTAGCTEAGEAIQRLGESPEEEDFDVGRLQIRLERQTRFGLTFAPFINGSFDSTQFLGKRDGFFEPDIDPLDSRPRISPSGIPLERFTDFGGKNAEDLYSVDMGFEVSVPLLRNRGAEAVAAGERAASIDLDAATLTIQHTASRSVLNTVVAYWRLVGAQGRVDIRKESVARQKEVSRFTEDRVVVGDLPKSEEARALAGVATAEAQLDAAQAEAASARADLLRAMGVAVGSGAGSLQAVTPFPSIPERWRAGLPDAVLVSHAITRRYDLAAARLRVESGQVLQRETVINLKPLWDVTMGAWANARGNESSEAVDEWVFPSWRFESAVEKPFANNVAKGRLLQRDAEARRRQLDETDLERTIAIGVVQAVEILSEAVMALDQATDAVRYLEATIRSEVDKFKVGDTPLLDVLLTEQQQTDSRLGLVQAQVDVATGLAQLRFETSTLFVDGDRPTLESLTSVPGLEADS